MFVLAGVVIIFICVFSRIWVRFDRKDFGVDTWYFLNYAEAFRKERRLPAKLSNYLLDIEEQWYPPVLAIILSFFSKRLVDKYHWLISALIDSIQSIILYIFSILFTGRMDVAIFATLLYISSTVNASMATNLNSRPLASLVSTLLMLSIYYFSLSPNIYSFGLILLFGAILLHTHKMATQQFVFFSIGLSFINRDLTYLYILIFVFIIGLISTKGFYIKILKNNIQIVKFWAKNLPYLLKHQVYTSPLYRDDKKAKEKIGISGLKMHRYMFYFAKAHLLLLLSIVIIFWILKNNIPDFKRIQFLFNWAFINYFTIISTTYFPYFKFIGEGFKYLIYGTFPISFLISYCTLNIIPETTISYAILIILIVSSFYIQIFTLSRQTVNVNSFVDEELKQVIKILRENKEDNIMCIPVFKAEPIAYLAEKKVLWGAHGSGWDKMDEFWPIIKVSIEKLIQKYEITFLLLDKRFVDIYDLKINQHIDEIFNGDYYILSKVRPIIG